MKIPSQVANLLFQPNCIQTVTHYEKKHMGYTSGQINPFHNPTVLILILILILIQIVNVIVIVMVVVIEI